MDFEKKLQQFYEVILKPGMNVVDVGAHVGRHALEMARLVAPNGKVIACEPIPQLYEYLNQLITDKKYKNILVVHPYAVADYEGRTDFHVAVDTLAYSGILERVYDYPTRKKIITVQVKTLDSIVQDTTISYIKIDVEGGEWNVIQGAKNSISLSRPYISFEFGENSYRNYKVDPRIVWQFFRSKSYSILDIKGRVFSSPDDFSISSVEQSVWDYVACPDEHLNFVHSILIKE